MILNFKSSNNPNIHNSISKWRGIIVILDSQIIGDIDVMFTGTTSKGSAVFATPVIGTKVYSKDGFMRFSNHVVSIAKETTNSSKPCTFSAGHIKNQLYIADEKFAKFRNIPLLRLGGYYYITKGYKSRCIGVDDPSMLLKFASHHPDFKKLA